jgi:alanine dehydrogenase
MAGISGGVTLGLPRIRNEEGERRDFLPELVANVTALGHEVVVESGYGSGMGYRDGDYAAASPLVTIGTRVEAHAQDVVLVLRPSEDSLSLLAPGTTFVSMLHFPTHADRARSFKEHGIEALALDLITNDEGTRLVENMRAVAWNGLDLAFNVLELTHRGYSDRHRGALRVTIMGAGMVGRYAVEAATKYGDLDRDARSRADRLPGVEALTIGRNLTHDERYMKELLRKTSILVDATSRDVPSKPVVPNEWLGELPLHAVICDLSVDPYLLESQPPVVRGIEGIPQGTLDHHVFVPEDPAWDETVPATISSHFRRTAVTCYSWPGLQPADCMAHYGSQLEPLLPVLLGRGGAAFLRSHGSAPERALARGSLAHWLSRL